MKANGGNNVPTKLKEKINKDFGSFEKFREEFINAGITQFGSGWCWLSIKEGKLLVTKTPNAENPIIHNMKPILGCDVWEHSYYLDYKNKRPIYLENFFRQTNKLGIRRVKFINSLKLFFKLTLNQLIYQKQIQLIRQNPQ